jgi:transcriptional regulator with XRE-family HTH domain
MRRNANPVRLRIGKNLRRLRLTRSWSQAALAEKVSLTDKEIGRIERAEAGTTLDRLMTFANVLQCDIAEFFTPTPAARAMFIVRGREVRDLEARLCEASKIVAAIRRGGPLT